MFIYLKKKFGGGEVVVGKLRDFTGTHPAVMKDRLAAGQDHDKIMGLYNYTEEK